MSPVSPEMSPQPHTAPHFKTCPPRAPSIPWLSPIPMGRGCPHPIRDVPHIHKSPSSKRAHGCTGGGGGTIILGPPPDRPHSPHTAAPQNCPHPRHSVPPAPQKRTEGTRHGREAALFGGGGHQKGGTAASGGCGGASSPLPGPVDLDGQRHQLPKALDLAGLWGQNGVTKGGGHTPRVPTRPPPSKKGPPPESHRHRGVPNIPGATPQPVRPLPSPPALGGSRVS